MKQKFLLFGKYTRCVHTDFLASFSFYFSSALSLKQLRKFHLKSLTDDHPHSEECLTCQSQKPAEDNKRLHWAIGLCMFVPYLTMQRHTHTHPHTASETQAESESKQSPPWVWSKSAEQLLWVAAIDFSSHLLTFGRGKHFHDNAVLINGGESYLSLQSVCVVKSILCSFLCMFIKMTASGCWYALTEMSCNPGSTFS